MFKTISRVWQHLPCQIFTTHRNEPSRSTVSMYEQKRTRQSLMLNTINNMPRTVQWKSILTSLFSTWNMSNWCFSDSHDIKKQSILFRKQKKNQGQFPFRQWWNRACFAWWCPFDEACFKYFSVSPSSMSSLWV